MKNDKKKPARARLKKHLLWIPLAAFVVSFPLFFSSLDLKLYDLFLRSLPSLTESPQVRLLTLDDDSVGLKGFPFPREAMADVVILLKELGAASVTFDLSYIDESPYRLDPVYAETVFSRYLDQGFGDINDAAAFIIDGIISGELTNDEGELYKEDFYYLNDQFRTTLEESLSQLTRDVDAYFSQALGMSNISWLNFTMRGRKNNAGYAVSAPEGELAELLERFSLKNIDALGDTRTPDTIGVLPTLPKLLRNAKGAGTVNADPDRDGIRRRIHLLLKYQDKYYPNLALIGMSEILGNPSIIVQNDAIILKNAQRNGIQQDIRIPRARDGSVLLKWPKKAFRNYKQSSLVEFIQYTTIEQSFSSNFSTMTNLGYSAFWDGGKSPWQLYDEAESIKEKLMEGGAASYSETMGEEWLKLRRDFYSAAEQFLFGNYEERILAYDSSHADFISQLFSVSRAQLSRMAAIRQKYEDIKGSFCVIGSDATSMTDNGTNPFEEDFPNMGTYAVLANMFLSGEFLGEAPLWVSMLIALVFVFGIAFITGRTSPGRSLIAGFSGLIVLLALLLGYFHLTKQFVAGAVPLISTFICFAAITVINFLGTNREKAFLHSAFSRYLSPDVVSELIADPSKLNLGGEKREMSAIFTDIQGFSGISEKLDPTQLVKLLNKYLTDMSNIIMENSGTVDKYEGDAIIAFFGAPLPREDHAIMACRSALAMKRAEKSLNAEVLEAGLSPSPIFTRIGVNTGDMVVGNMGAENKMDYTIMGNAVNLAARLEGVNKQYHTGGILISEFTHKQAGNEFISRRLDRVRVVGVNTPLRLHELMSLAGDADRPSPERLAAWEQAINLFEAREFAKAMEIFSSLNRQYPDDHVAELYVKRCDGYIQKPPSADWDGVFNLTEK